MVRLKAVHALEKWSIISLLWALRFASSAPNKDDGSLWFCVEGCEIKDFTRAFEVNVDADVTVLEIVRESYSKMGCEIRGEINVTLFNPIIDGDRF